MPYRVTTHDLRPPVRGGDPIMPEGEALPYRLPVVDLDRGPDRCAPGWHAARTPEAALRWSGLWPDGRPSRLWRVEPVEGAEVIDVEGDCRSSTWDVVEEVEVTDEILATLHAAMAGDGLPLADLVAEVQAWRQALARPAHDPIAVEVGLRAALAARGLGDWTLRPYATAWAAWAARAAVDTRDALTVYVGARRGWTQQRPDLLTVGLRDAYAAGLAVVLPVAPGVLGWAMVAP